MCVWGGGGGVLGLIFAGLWDPISHYNLYSVANLDPNFHDLNLQ